MGKNYVFENRYLILILFLLISIASCKKDEKSPTNTTGGLMVTNLSLATPTKLGLYEADSSIYKELIMAVSKIGNQSVDYGLFFDTGSGGLVIDANGILPPSMITSSGFNFTGDSTVVNGITITNQQSMVEYGDDVSTTDKVYGNLAYAQVTVGDDNGNIVVKRLPFFIYYKAVDGSGNVLSPHEFDVFGVSEEYDITFPNNAYITSPFSYFDPGNGLTRGFKIAALGTSHFSLAGNYVPNVITLGLTTSDLSSSSGFTMSQLTYYTGDGYAPIIPAAVTYNNKTISTDVLFDTGTDPYSYIEDRSASRNETMLAQNTSVAINTSSGFNYPYVTSATDYLTYVENPNVSQNDVTIFGLEFFLNNEYMLDFANHRLGLKNN